MKISIMGTHANLKNKEWGRNERNNKEDVKTFALILIFNIQTVSDNNYTKLKISRLH